MTASACTLCGGLSDANLQLLSPNDAFRNGFMLGVIAQRIVAAKDTPLVRFLCAEHLRQLREIAAEIPLEVVGPDYRYLLNFGLASVG